MFIVSMIDRYEQRTYLEIKAILVSMYRVWDTAIRTECPFSAYLTSRTKSPKTVSVNLMSRVKSQVASVSSQASHAIGCYVASYMGVIILALFKP